MSDPTTRCSSLTVAGSPCQRPALDGKAVCFSHDASPEGVLARQERSREANAAKARHKAQAVAPAPIDSLDSPEACGEVLDRVIAETTAGTMTAKTASALVKAIQARLRVHDLAISERLEQLEQAKVTVPGGVTRRRGAHR